MLRLFLICTSINLSGMLLGKILTQHKYFSLARFSTLFNRKPFNCKPCLTFHILWIIYTIISILLSSWLIWSIGLVFSITIFIVLHLDNKSKIIK